MRVFIRERRMERHMTQRQLCERMADSEGKPFSQTLMSKYERNKIPAPLEIILWIADILQYKVEDLASRE
jgi:transcriptional regulator with XRE-family HTH domain